ncbi:hypothetical protein [Kordiimonas sp.]|uniref:hypothetical protein n=1 Tax=Kordiimonas sp. TaxID=1970157 RepID=UPI003A90001E
MLFKKKSTSRRRSTTRRKSTALKPGTRRVKGRVVPKKGYRFVKNGGGRAIKARG